MPINRMLWKFEITEHHVPEWPCPNCQSISLELVKGSFLSIFDGTTHRSRHHPDFDHEWVSGRFVCLLRCRKEACGESCAVAGTYTSSIDHDEDGCRTYDSGRPTSIIPPPPMIQIPKECPKPIRQEVVAAFSLFWIDHAACLNRIRNAIELMLTEMGVKRHGRKSGGGRTRLALDSRIQVLRSKKPSLSDLCDRLLAVKHLGNAGSHPGDVSQEDVFDGFDILERVLHDAYSDQEGVMAKMVAQINKRKGPRKGRK